jgi:hypothetical protein
VEEVGDLLEYQVEDRHALNLLELADIHNLPGELNITSVLSQDRTKNRVFPLFFPRRLIIAFK